MPASTLSPHPCVPAQVLAREREADGKLRLGGRGDGKEWGRKQVWEGSLSRVKGPLCTYYPEHPGHGQSPRSSPPSPPWWLQKGIPAPGGDHLGPLKLNLYSNLRRGARLPPGPQRPGSSSRRPSSKGTGPLLPDIMQGAAVGVPGGWEAGEGLLGLGQAGRSWSRSWALARGWVLALTSLHLSYAHIRFLCGPSPLSAV